MADVLEHAAPVADAIPSPAAPASATPLPRPRASAPQPAATKARQGLPPITWALTALAVVMFLWAAWVTKHIASAPPQLPMASVRLEALVTEYVQAQSHSNGTPDAVTQQTARFMSAIEDELKRVGASGTTVLVGEAVLSKNVPDITDQVRKAVYAKVPLPTAAPAPAAGPQLGAAAPAPILPQQGIGAAAVTAPSPFAGAPVGTAFPGAASPIAGGGNGLPN